MTLHQKDITLLNIYATNKGAPKHIKQLLRELKGKNDKNTNMVGDLNTPLITLDRSSKKSIKKYHHYVTH